MKYLLLSLLLLQGCGNIIDTPKFKVGDCAVSKYPRERWEQPATIDKIVEIGKEKYRYAIKGRSSDAIIYLDFPIYSYDKLSVKVDCPSYLKDVK